MNELSRLNHVTAPGDNSISKTPIHAVIACAAIYAPLCVFMLATGGLIERVVVSGLGGYSFWTAVWIIWVIIIINTEKHIAGFISTGLIYGAIVGLASGYVLTIWPSCSQPTDPTPQILVMGIGAPAILFHAISFGRLSEGNNPVLFLLSSATFWSMFGLVLAALSKLRRLKAQHPLASD
jgi:hypothetical protein